MPHFADLPSFGGTIHSYGIPGVDLFGVPTGVVPGGVGGKYVSGIDPTWLRPGSQPGNMSQSVMPWNGPRPGLSGLGALARSVPGGTAPPPFWVGP